MKKIFSLITLTVLILSISMLFIGCSTNDSEASSSPKAATDSNADFTVTLVGSTSVGVVAEPLAQAFEAKYSNASVEVQGGGSTTGVTQTINNATDIGMASRNLKDSEEGKGLVVHKIAVDGIAIVIHPSNTITNLTADQIKGLFTGDIKNWNEVGGKDQAVVVVSREPGSGTRGAFEEILDIEDMVLETIVSDSTGGARTTVSSNENAIAYISAGSLEDSVKAVVVDNIACTTQNIASGTYTISRPLLMLTNGEPNDNAQKFLDFVLSSEGQTIVEEEGFVKVK